MKLEEKERYNKRIVLVIENWEPVNGSLNSSTKCKG